MKLSLRTAIVLAILLGLLLPASLSGLLSAQSALKQNRAELARTHQRYLNIMVLGIQEPLWNLAPEAGRPLLDSLMDDERIVRITVNEASTGVFLTTNQPERRQGHLLSLTHAITRQGAMIGSVTIEMDDGHNIRSLESQIQQYLLVTVAQIIISLALVLFLIQTRITAPAKRLIQHSRQLARNELDTPFEWKRNDEIGILGRNLDTTRIAIKDLLGKLEQKNLQLEVDLMSRVQVESALLAAQNRYRRLFENTHVIPWDANPGEWRFTYIGPQAEKLLGYPLSVWYSEGFLTSYLHPDDRHLAYQLFTDFQQEEREFECRLLSQDGHEVWILLTASTHIDENERRRLQGFIMNITARKENELSLKKYHAHLEELVESRSRSLSATTHELEAFSYSVSHDLRTPLRAIDGFSQVLLEDYSQVLDSNARHYLQRIRSAINGMASLIDDLLNLSKLSRTELRCQTTNLSAIVEEIAEELNALQGDQPVSLECTPDLYAYVDPKLIRIVLHNLLDNAWRFCATTPSPRVCFGITQAGQQQVFFVKDNGIGFDMEDASCLFNPFQHLHTQSESVGGNGIGLAIVQRIISRHEGHIWAKSISGEGASFYFTLPMQKKALSALP